MTKSALPDGWLTGGRGAACGLAFAAFALSAGAAVPTSFDATLNTADTKDSALSFSTTSHWTFADPSSASAPNAGGAEGKTFYAEAKDIYVPIVTTAYGDNVFYGTLYYRGGKRIHVRAGSYVWFKGGVHLLNSSPYLQFDAGDIHMKGDVYFDERPSYISLGSGNTTLHFDGEIGGASRMCIVSENSTSATDATAYWNGGVADFTGNEILWSHARSGYLYMVFAQEASFPTVTKFALHNGVVFRTCKKDSVNTIKALTFVRSREDASSSQLDPVNGSTIVVDGACEMQSSTAAGLGGIYFAPTNGTVRIKTLTIGEGATLGATYAGADATDSCRHPIEVTTGLTLPQGQVGLRVDYAAGVTGGPGEVQILKVPTSVKTLTPDMFKVVQGRVADIPEGFGLPTVTNVAIRVEGGDQIVCAYPRALVRAVKKNSDDNCLSKPDVWSDNQVVHDGADYYSAYGLQFSSDEIPADSMSIDATLSTRSLWSRDLRINGRQIQSYNGLNWRGKARLLKSTTGNATSVLVYSKDFVPFPISADLSGPGILGIVYRGHKGDTCQGGRVYLTGDNSGLTGAVKVYSQNAEDGKTEEQWLNDSNWNVTVYVEDEKNLGGALPDFTYNGLLLQDWACLAVTNDVTLSDNNRGVMISRKAHIDVADGATLAINRPIVYTGLLRKDGAGTLALGARPKFNGSAAQDQPVAGENLLVVHEGAVKPLSTAAFTSLDVTFEEATTLAVNATGNDAELLAKGLVLTGERAKVTWPEGTVNVRFDGLPDFSEAGPVGVGVITLPTKAEAQAALGKLRAGRIRSAKAVLRVADAANADGTWSVVADIGRAGLVLIFR